VQVLGVVEFKILESSIVVEARKKWGCFLYFTSQLTLF
jgi:hypothetical protein